MQTTHLSHRPYWTTCCLSIVGLALLGGPAVAAGYLGPDSVVAAKAAATAEKDLEDLAEFVNSL